MDSIKKNNSELEATIKDLKTQLNNKNQEIVGLSEEIKQQKGVENELKKQIEDTAKSFESQRTEAGEASKKELMLMEHKLKMTEGIKLGLQQKLKEKEEELGKVKEQAKKEKEEYKKMTAKKSKDGVTAQLQARITELEGSVKKLEDSKKTICDSYEEKVEEMKGKLYTWALPTLAIPVKTSNV